MTDTFTCIDCGMTSHNPNDAAYSYCGNCHTTWRTLGPGVWTNDAGELHLDLDACLAGNGYEPNEQTRRMLEQCWRDMAEQLGAELVIRQ